MRCPSCSKFAPYEYGNAPEVELSFDFSPDSVEVNGNVRIVLTSECCGDELKESSFDVAEDVTDRVRAALIAGAEGVELPEGVDRDALVEACKVYPLDTEQLTELLEGGEWDDGGEVQVNTITTTKRRLKSGQIRETPIKNSRYWRTEYGFLAQYSVSGELDMVVDGKAVSLPVEFDLELSDYIPASAMDEMV